MCIITVTHLPEMPNGHIVSMCRFVSCAVCPLGSHTNVIVCVGLTHTDLCIHSLYPCCRAQISVSMPWPLFRPAISGRCTWLAEGAQYRYIPTDPLASPPPHNHWCVCTLLTYIGCYMYSFAFFRLPSPSKSLGS